MVRSTPPLELWGGVECTLNRVGNRRFDQLLRTGHTSRIEDLDLFKEIGIATLRYPVLWEYVVSDDGSWDWSWADERLGRMRELGIRPMVGLLHHGAGPGDGGFMDPAFPENFAHYARRFAERYPWVQDYIPINEPLTTARFCGLYGVWHPHATDDRTFAQILMAQIKATVLAIRSIREINPDARFTQNEDMGTIRSVPALRYQAEFENERRWVTFDLLSGALEPEMLMWERLRRYGISEATLEWFRENPTAPDILACDNYLTSDRLLDDRIERYPEWSHGGNGTHVYADIEAVRVTTDEPAGILPVLREAWDRYRRPIAIGEAHLGCTRDEQLRWIRDTWKAASQARNEGVDVRAVTVWALLGSYDWNTLATEENGYYEPGAFDVRTGSPRKTAIAHMLEAMSRHGEFAHPVLESEGWWRRDTRLTYPPVELADPLPFGSPPLSKEPISEPSHLVCVGETGPFLDSILRVAEIRDLPFIELEQKAKDDIGGRLAGVNAWAVIDVAGCWNRPPGSHKVASGRKGERTRALASACAELGLPLVLLSCRHVVHRNGKRDPCGPSVSAKEAVAREVHDQVLIVRVEAPLKTTPGHIRGLADVALDLLIDGETGVWELNHDTSRVSADTDSTGDGASDADSGESLEEIDTTLEFPKTELAPVPVPAGPERE